MSPIRCTDCSALGSFPDVVKSLVERGFVAVTHSDITRLKCGQYLVHAPSRRSAKDVVRIYFRE